MTGLYETATRTGVLAVSEFPASSASGVFVDDGTLVEVREVESFGTQLWVLIASPEPDSEPFGWTLADDLVVTDQVVADRPWSLVRRFHEIVGGTADLRSEPSDEAAESTELSSRAVVHSTGNRVRTSSGSTFIELSVPGSDEPLGWVSSDVIEPIESITARYADDSPAPSTYPGGFEVGAGTSQPIAVGACGGFQVTVTSIDDTDTGRGSHLCFGPNRPSAVWTGDPEAVSWSFGAGEGTVFIAPGASVTITIPTPESDTWHLMHMDPGTEAPWVTDRMGEPRLGAGDTLRPSRGAQVSYDSEACTAG